MYFKGLDVISQKAKDSAYYLNNFIIWKWKIEVISNSLEDFGWVRLGDPIEGLGKHSFCSNSNQSQHGGYCS